MYDLLRGLDHLRLTLPGAASEATASLRQLSQRLGFAVAPAEDRREAGCWMLAGQHIALLPGSGGFAARLNGITLDSPDLNRLAAQIEEAGGTVSRDVAVTPSPRLSVAGTAAPGLAAELIPSRSGFDPRRLPQTLMHPNTAERLLSLTLVMETPELLAFDYDQLFGPFAATPTDDMLTIHCNGILIYVVTADGFDHLHPDLDMDPPGAGQIGVVSLAVRDPAAAGAWLRQQGLRCLIRPTHVTVPQQQGLDFGLELIGG